ncbi:hypothetical protein BZA77DRAFT_327999 [Pyronema omphalodes]|nr:hypothetical protein BZA77DRAFT_327999 [Pyronema omphalodes]
MITITIVRDILLCGTSALRTFSIFSIFFILLIYSTFFILCTSSTFFTFFIFFIFFVFTTLMARLNSRSRAARRASKASSAAARRRRSSFVEHSDDDNAEESPPGNSENYSGSYSGNHHDNHFRNEEISPNANPTVPFQPNPPNSLPSLAEILPPYTLIPRRSIDEPNLHDFDIVPTPSALQPGLPIPAPVIAERVLVNQMNRHSFSWMNTSEPHHIAPLEPLHPSSGIQRQNIDMSVVKLEEPGPYDYNSRYYGSM